MVDLVKASLLRTEVASELPNVPNPVVDQNIVHATRMLCDEVALWQETHDVNAASGRLDLSALEDQDRDVVRVMPRGVAQDGKNLAQYIRPNVPDGLPLGYYVKERRLLLLTPDTPDGAFQITAQLRPAIQTMSLPGSVIHDYHDVVVHGALYRLFRMPSETWASAEAAQAHYQQFMDGAKRARSEVNRIHTDA